MKFRKLFLLICFFIVLLNQVFGNLFLSEILPNTDDDVNLEYIELYNDSDSVMFLSGYILKDASDKEFIFGESYFLNAYEKKKYTRNDTKILLNNTDEQLFLYDNFGNLLDSYSYTTSEKGKVIVIYGSINNTEVLDESIIESNTGSTDEGTETGSLDILSDTGSIDDNLIYFPETQSGSTSDNIENNTGSIDSLTGSIYQENQDTILIQTGVTDNIENTGSVDEIVDNNNFLVPNIEYSFQVPTYLVEKEDIISLYNCDSSKEECKINIDLRNSFVGDFRESDFNCEIDFGFDTGEENKCNPGTIIVPIGIFDFKLKLISKSNSLDFIEKSFKIINKGYIKPTGSSSNVFISNVYNSSNKINITKPEIIIQSGINNKNECTNKQSCSINLNYEIKNSKERCLWDFGTATYDSGTQNKCNPGYVKYGFGNFLVKLKVFEDGNENNYNTSELRFNNIKEETKVVVDDNQDKEKQEENKELMYVVPYSSNENNFDYTGLKLNKLMPNPVGNDDFEYIEIINNSKNDLDLYGCKLDDILDGGSKPYSFSKGEKIKKGELKKYYKDVTKVNLNNDNDEVNLFCNDVLIDKLSWDFKVKDGYYLDHTRLDVFSGKAKVVEVIDGDTIKVQFLNSNKIEKMRLVGIDTPETKNPNTEVQLYGLEAYDFVNDNLSGEDIDVEIDPNNLRDTYSRLLGFVYKDGESFNKKLIELGYAKAYLDYEFKYSDEYKKAETVAKNQHIGIWASNTIVSSKVTSKTVDVKNNNVGTGSIEAIITIQGKIGKNKTITGNSITCFDTCSINFDGTESTGNIKKYSWDFGNGQKFEGKNPKGIKYEKFGNYKVYLAVLGESGELNIGEYIVNFYKTPKKVKTSSIVPKAEASSKEKVYNDEKVESLDLLNTAMSRKSIMVYIFIGVFGVLLVVMLLWKEKML